MRIHHTYKVKDVCENCTEKYCCKGICKEMFEYLQKATRKKVQKK